MKTFNEIRQEILEEMEDECGNDDLNELKTEIAWVLGLEDDSDEWYAKITPERETLLNKLQDGEIETPHPTNKYGVEVGDIFKATWGYDQTNVNFFQVKQVVGKCSVRVVEVTPEIIKESPVSSMSGDFTFKLSHSPLPAKDTSVFIKDQFKGDLKRLRVNFEGEKPSFNLSSYTDAYLCNSDTITEYISWYA